MARFVLFFSLLLCLSGCSPSPISSRPETTTGLPPVILISIDGFRPDYLHQGDTPTLDAVADRGVTAPLRPSFPTITFPNHYTLVTGLRPDHHGIIGNTMTDPTLPNEVFSVSHMTNLDDPRWWQNGVPAWVTAQMHGLMTAVMFWPGSDVPIFNTRPDIWYHFDATRTPNQRVETALSWFDHPNDRKPALAMLYFDGVDHAGHKYGPFSPQTRSAIHQIDTALATLLSGLDQRHVIANIIIVSDHGMTALSPHRIVQLSDLAPASAMSIITSGPYAGINPVHGHERELAKALAKSHDHVTCWPKDRIPKRLHYGSNPRIPAYLCLAEIGWSLVRNSHKPLNAGGHGYDNAAPDMTATFIASGPAFVSHKTLPMIDNIDVYPLVMMLLGLLPQTSDGSLTPLQGGLHETYRAIQ